MAEESKEKKKRSVGEIAMWGLMGLLVIGLGVGFGFDSGLSGAAQRVAQVGDKDVTINAYVRRLQNQLQTIRQQTRQPLSFAEAQAGGLDRAVLEQLMRESALEHEAGEMGISIGDESVRDQILQISSFQGLDGQFDREGYSFALESAGLTEAQFELQLRDETARNILQSAILGGVAMPATYAETIVSFVAETRDITRVRFDLSDLETELEAADDATLRAYYDDNIDQFQLPESKRITFVVLQPEDLAQTFDVSQEDLREEYQSRLAEFNSPERRLVERLVYLDDAAAEAAAAQLDVGTTFEALVDDRGLTLDDVDLGDVGRLELDAAGEAVFAAEVGDVVGPLPSSLGPALFRVNGILPAQSRAFEDVEDLLRQGLSVERARRQLEIMAEDFNDILAGGATLEDLAGESDMELGTIDWYPDFGEGIAGYLDFAQAAARVTEDDFPEIFALSDGSIFALRLDEILPERPNPFDLAREDVQARWETERAERLLTEAAEAYLPQITDATDMTTLGLLPQTEAALERNASLPGTPPNFIAEVFEMSPGEVRLISGFGAVNLVRLDAINDASSNPDADIFTRELNRQANSALATEIFGIFTGDALLRAGQQVDLRTLEAVNANFQ